MVRITFYLLLLLCLGTSQLLKPLVNENKKTIIILKGTSSAGKSSICRALENKHNWPCIIEDDYWLTYAINYWESIFPSEYGLIKNAIARENIYHAINRHQVIYKPEVTEEIKHKAAEALSIIREFLNNQSETALQEYNKRFISALSNGIEEARTSHCPAIVIESFGMVDALINNLSDTFTVYPILVYVPLHVMFDRIIERNAHSIELGNLWEHRLYAQAFTGLLHLFSIGYNNTEKSIDVITKEDKDAFDRVEQYLSTLVLPYKIILLSSRRDFTIDEFHDIKRQILGTIKEHENVYITAKFDYELLIYSDTKTPEEHALQIVNFVTSKQMKCDHSERHRSS